MQMRVRRRTFPKRGGRRAAGFITLFRQDIPRDRFSALTDADRYCMMLLGQIHDELSWLQRIAFITSRSRPNREPVKQSADMMQVLFITRMFLGKLNELNVILEGQAVLRDFIVANHPGGTGATVLAELQVMYTENAWLRKARNQSFLHYPTMAQLLPTLNDPNVEWDVQIYHGKKTANTFYPAADVAANLHWFRLANSTNVFDGLTEALGAAKRLAALAMSALEQSIGNFIHLHLRPLNENTAMRLPVRESVFEAKLDYFMSVERRG